MAGKSGFTVIDLNLPDEKYLLISLIFIDSASSYDKLFHFKVNLRLFIIHFKLYA